MTRTVAAEERWIDELSFDQLKQLVGLVDYDASTDRSR